MLSEPIWQVAWSGWSYRAECRIDLLRRTLHFYIVRVWGRTAYVSELVVEPAIILRPREVPFAASDFLRRG